MNDSGCDGLVTDDAQGNLRLAVLIGLVERAGDQAGARNGVVGRFEQGGVEALQVRRLGLFVPRPVLVKGPAEVAVGLLTLQLGGGNVLPLDRLEIRLDRLQVGAFPCDVVDDVVSRFVVELADDLIRLLRALDEGLRRNAAGDVLTGVERTGDAAGRTLVAVGLDRTGREAVADVAAAVLNARDAADVIRRFEDRVDIAVIDLADDRAFALLDLARDAAAGMGVRQVVDPDLTGDEAVRDRAVVNAYQTADVLLAVDLAVEQGDVLDEGRFVLVADVAEQADVLLGIVDLQVLDRV